MDNNNNNNNNNDAGDCDLKCIGTWAAVCVLIPLLIIASCWSTVEPLEFGLECNSFTKTCDTKKIYEGGRYWVGLFNYFITFPSNYQTIEFSKQDEANSAPLNSRTAEGLALGISLSFQYKLIKFNSTQIPELYYMANQQYEQTFIRIARDVILQSAGNYEAPVYWSDRKKIASDMFEALKLELKKAYCKLVSLQILVVDLPEQYENSIISTQVFIKVEQLIKFNKVEKQNRRMKEFEQQAEIIRQQIKIMESQMNQEIKAIDANGSAKAYSIKQSANAEAQTKVIEAESSALTEAKTDLGLNQDQLNEYLFDIQMMQNNEAKIIVGMNNALINLKEK